MTVTPTEFRFEGNTLLSDAQLNAAVAGYLHRPLNFAALQQAAESIAVAYRDAGWFVRAYLPKQQIDAGVVLIQVVEARFGKVQLDDSAHYRVPAARMRAVVNQAQAPNEPVSATHIDRALLLLDDLPGVAVTGALVPGAEEGQTDLALRVTDEPLVVGSLSADNTGERSTGEGRVTGNLGVNSPLGQGDQSLSSLVKSDGLAYLRSAYSLPMGYDGSRTGVHASYLTYKLTGDLAALDATGNASVIGLDLSRPLVRSIKKNLNFTVTLDHKQYRNAALSAASRYHIDALNTALTGDWFDRSGGGGANTFGIAVVQGWANLHHSPNQAADTAAADTQGAYTKMTLSASRQQRITADLSLYAIATVQRASRNLDSSEKIYLGGAYGVRAYPANEAGGSEGQTFTTELRQRLGDGWTVSAFYDYGHIDVYRQNSDLHDAALTPTNQVSLAGYGLSANWQIPGGVDLKATLARRVGSNPLANTETGRDSDGSHISNRVWVTATWTF